MDSGKKPVGENSSSVSEEQTFSVPEKDVQLVLNVINVVSRRGGFTPQEFKVVGELYEKFNSFVQKEE